jgi:hypothetical protein
MARLFYDMMVFAIAIQLVAYLLWSFNFFGGIIQYPFGSAADLNNLSNTFSLTSFNALLGIGGAALIGLAALLLRQGTYAIFACLLWAIGAFFNIVKGFVLAIPNTVAALLPSSTNPGTGLNPLQVVIGFIVLFAGFMFLFELVIQRNVS